MIKEKTGISRISKTIVPLILHDDLKKWKIRARFVPHALTVEQCDQRVAYVLDLLEMVKNDPEFLDLIITGDESWCFAYDRETNYQKTS